MKSSSSRVIRASAHMTLTAAALFAAATAGAAARSAGNSAEAQYRQERQACMSGQSHQDRATCLKEAAAAASESRRNRLGGGAGAADYRQNALARCDAQPPSEQESCRALARGEGVSRGTAEQGGIIRERTTRVPGTAAERAPMPGASAPR